MTPRSPVPDVACSQEIFFPRCWPAWTSALSQASAVQGCWADAAEPSWQQVFEARWRRSLFAFCPLSTSRKQKSCVREVSPRSHGGASPQSQSQGQSRLTSSRAPLTSTSWRARCSLRALARRADLSVMSSQWQLRGTVRDSKGEMSTEADCRFLAGSFMMQGAAVHRREDRSGRTILHGNWQGNLCADIVRFGGKRKWCLAWREKLAEARGAYDYAGQMEEMNDGRIGVQGEFRWLGRVRGTFDYVMERLADDADSPSRPS
ncbi:unnamed protein product [Polarella glacialis]|uniref:Uncharacterized protein n=1 Tax=Polarella glacialis TaxID=89957 RepID=A0A813FFR5_POLGL|nr:unnamed protein product [Polarella glacialis]